MNFYCCFCFYFARYFALLDYVPAVVLIASTYYLHLPSLISLPGITFIFLLHVEEKKSRRVSKLARHIPINFPFFFPSFFMTPLA